MNKAEKKLLLLLFLVILGSATISYSYQRTEKQLKSELTSLRADNNSLEHQLKVCRFLYRQAIK